MVEHKRRFISLLHPLFVMAAYLFIYLPIFVMVFFSFNESELAAKWTGFSLKWYQALFSSPELIDALKTSMIVAISSTGLSVFLGASLVIASRWWKPFYLFPIFYTNVVIPDIVIGIGLLSLFTFLAIPVGYTSLIVGHTLIGLGFVIPILRARFSELDPKLIEASLDLGATYSQTLTRVVVPLMMPAIVASALIVFTLSLDDFLISFFCSGPTAQTLSLYVYAQVRSVVDPTVNALSACLLLLSSLIALIMSFFDLLDEVFSHE